MRLIRCLGIVLLSFAATAQSGPTNLTFVAADVHASAKDVLQIDGLAPGNRVTIRGASLSQLIADAYDVPEDRVVGGPKWLDVDQFDVIAKAAGASSLAELRTMLQALLAERFQLKAHKTEKPSPAYALTASKRGLQLKPSKGGEDGGCKRPQDGSVSQICTGVSMSRLAEILPSLAPAYFNHPVVDRTGAKGNYDFSLKWTGRGMLGSSPDTVSLYDYLEKQLGIKVEQETISLAAIVVESVNETPTPNASNVKDALPPMPTEFEVAEVKVNKGADQRHDFSFNHGRLDAVGIPLKPIIGFAYGVDDGMIVGQQGWMDTDFFDIVAKTDPAVDFEGMRPMLRKLLSERFGLVVHNEERPVTVYALTAGKAPKLTTGNASARGGCKLTVDNGLRTYTCENASMADLADKAPGVAAGYLDHPVVDLTGLKGAYNFAISWNGVRRTRPATAEQKAGDATAVAAAPLAGGAANAASDPGSGITFFQGVEKIGLKLTQQKHTMPVVVIDKLSRTPVEN